jgi:endo-1,3(4)-beta-glucanase
VALEQDGHSSEQPFPQFDVGQFINGLEDLLGEEDNTDRAPEPVVTEQSTDTGNPDPVQATTTAKLPETSAPIATTGSVADSPQAESSTTVAQGKIEHELV